MKDTFPLVCNISSIQDINKLKTLPNVKYINLDITNPNIEVILYLIENGQNYSYTDMIDGKNGYIYVSYEIFKKSELFILDIIKKSNPTFTPIEVSRYLYIQIGKHLGYDINILPDKNETFNLTTISTINNIWGAIYNKKGTNVSFTKLYLYLAKLMQLDCNLKVVSKLGYLKNTITIDKKTITIDITQDIPFIQASFQTRYFLGYNNNLDLDKKIGYIQENYSENLIDQALKSVDYTTDNFLEEILLKTQTIINVSKIKPIELSTIYNIIFSKYCPNCDITINNLFIQEPTTKEHFILISYKGKYYSYNYTHKSFARISPAEIQKNIDSKKIGIYLNEQLPLLTPKPKEIS